MFLLIKQWVTGILCFSRSFVYIVDAAGHKKCKSFNNLQCMTQLTLINLHPNGYIEGLLYYPFAVNSDRFMEIFNTLNDLSNWAWVPSKTGDLNLSAFHKITGINESKIFLKHISWKCKCKFDSGKCNSCQNWNNDKFRCECKNLQEHHSCKKILYLESWYM